VLFQYISIFLLYSVLEFILALYFDMVMISREFMHMFKESLIQFWIGLSGWHSVGMVLDFFVYEYNLY
jgi:hypothetical protein